MAKKRRIIEGHTLDQYDKRYGKSGLRKVQKKYADKDETLLDGSNWWLIDETYYELPKNHLGYWWKNLSKAGKVALCVLGVGAVTTAVVVPTVLAINHKLVSIKAQKEDTDGLVSGDVTFNKNDDGTYEGTITYKNEESKAQVASIKLKVGGIELDADKYTVNLSTGKITIKAGVIKDGETITIEVTKKDTPEPTPTPTVSSITVNADAVKKHQIGDALDLTGIKVTAHYSDSTTKEIDKKDVTFNPSEGTKLTSAGENEITVTYGNVSQKFSINVIAPEPGPELISQIKVKIGENGDETLLTLDTPTNGDWTTVKSAHDQNNTYTISLDDDYVIFTKNDANNTSFALFTYDSSDGYIYETNKIKISSTQVYTIVAHYDGENGIFYSFEDVQKDRKKGCLSRLTNFGNKLNKIVIPSIINSCIVQSLKNSSFYGYKTFKSVHISANLTAVATSFGNNNLEEITVSKNNTFIKSEGNCCITKSNDVLLFGCKNSIIPNTVTKIGDSAFYDCIGLSSITIPDSVTEIIGDAFKGCINLTSINIPASVTSIDGNPFTYNTNLESITVDENNQNYKSENNCCLTKDGTQLIFGCKSSNIPESVTTIKSWSFSGCTGITTININKGITDIDPEAFAGTINVESITVDSDNTKYKSDDNCCTYTNEYEKQVLLFGCKNSIIPSNVQEIAAGAFYNCTGLSSIKIPNTVVTIWDGAFEKCYNLSKIHLSSTTPPTLEFNALMDTNENLIIYVPEAAVDTYKAADGWKEYADIIEAEPDPTI